MTRFTIETPAKNKSGWRRVPDTAFESKERATEYGNKYHKVFGAPAFRVVVLNESKYQA